MTKLRILCVGTGRDGTQSVNYMVQHLLDRCGGGQAMHEYCCREFCQAFCDHRETGDSAYLTALQRMVVDCSFDCIVSHGYAAILPLFAEQYGRSLKLVHLRRADRGACIASLMKNCELFPTAYRYYSSSPEAKVSRMAAFHFDEMSKTDWDRLPIEERFAWYYDKTHALIDGYGGLFDEQIEIETETLGEEATRRTLARVVTGTDAALPPNAHLNAASIDIATFPTEHQHKMHWLMGRLNLQEIARDDVYALDYFLEKYIAWTGYQITNAPQLETAKPVAAEKIRADLGRAIGTVRRRLREMESLHGLREHHHADQERPRAPAPSVELVKEGVEAGMNDLRRYADVFDTVRAWSGTVPRGYVIDFLGIIRPEEFTETSPGNSAHVEGVEKRSRLPSLGEAQAGESFWFEALNWILAARDARERFVMISLGALHGYQAVGSCRALQLVNPMPYKLVAVEPIPENILRMRQLMRANGIDPDDQWIVQAAVSDTNEPAFFPVGAAGGGWNCVSTDNQVARADYFKQFILEERTEEALRSLLLHNSTGLQKEIVDGRNISAEIKLVSCVTLRDLLGPFDRIDFLEADMQESEIRAFPLFLDLLRRKVKRVHIATHGSRVHDDLHTMFVSKGWNIVFSYAPETTHPSPWGPFKTNDGVLTVVNPDL